MRKILLIIILSLIITPEIVLARQNVKPTRVYLNNSVKSYAANSKSPFTSSVIDALNSGGGEDGEINIAELFSFLQQKELKADTVTYGKNEAGSDFVFQKKGKSTKGKNYALIVYIEDYDTWEDISGIAPDAEKLSSILQSIYGFETEVLANATRTELLLALRKLTMNEYSDNDKLFIYFAGQGYYDELYKWNYLVLKDSKKDDEVKYSYMPVSQLLMLADNMPVKKVMVVIDAGTK